MAVDHNNPQSRNEEILIATIDGTEYNKPPQSRIEELLLELKETIEEGGGGTTNYENLSNQPQVNGETLIGDKSGADLGLVDAEEGKGLSTNDYDNNEKAAVAAATSAISAMQDGSELDSFGDVEVALLDKADVSDLGTAAAKDSTNAVTSGSTDLVESGAVKDAIDAAVAAAYHHAGTKTVAQLTHDLLIAANEGNVYNITDSGTTTSDFIEGIGKTIDEGSNVGICKVGNTYMFDLLSGFVDTTNFVQKSQTAGLLKNDGTVNDEIEGDVDTLKDDVNAIDSKIDDSTTYHYADVITIPDAIPANLADCKVKIEPVQDLHGYDHPWVGGAGKNKLPMTVDGIKAANTSGTWSGNTYTYNDIVYTLVTDNDGNIIKITVNGTTTLRSFLIVGSMSGLIGQEVIMNGGASGGVASYTASGYCMFTGGVGVPQIYDIGSGATFTVSSYGGDVQINVNNISVTNLDFYPMLRLATETDATFAPYTNYCPITGHTEAVIYKHNQNWWDEDWESGDINTTTGQPGPNSNFIRSKNYNSILPNTKYYGKKGQSGQLVVYYYDVNKNYIDFALPSNSDFTTPDNCAFFKIRLSGNTYNGDVCINVFNEAINGTYFKYAGKTYTIALGDTIYGGEVDFNTGVMTVTDSIVDLGTLTYTYESENTRFTANISGMKAGNPRTLPLSCECYEVIDDGRSYQDVPDYSVYNRGGLTTDVGGIHISDSRYTDPSDLATALDGMQLVYPLATPFTVQLTPQQIQLLKGQNTLTASTGDISVTVNGMSGAIGSLTSDKQDKTDYALETTTKTVVGGINELKDRVKVIEVTMSDTVDQGTTVKVPAGYDAARAVIVGYTAQRTNALWYNADDHVVVGMYSEYLYAVPKNADVLGQTVKVVLVKISE